MIIWPAYIDANRSRSDGRKISQRDAVKSPSVDEIAEAARSLGFSVDVEHHKSYPRSHWERSGRVVITDPSRTSKINLLRKIASEIKSGRAEKQSQREIKAKKKARKDKKKSRQKGKREK